MTMQQEVDYQSQLAHSSYASHYDANFLRDSQETGNGYIIVPLVSLPSVVIHSLTATRLNLDHMHFILEG